MNIRKKMSEDIAKKIIGNRKNAETFLLKLYKIKKIDLKIKKSQEVKIKVKLN